MQIIELNPERDRTRTSRCPCTPVVYERIERGGSRSRSTSFAHHRRAAVREFPRNTWLHRRHAAATSLSNRGSSPCGSCGHTAVHTVVPRGRTGLAAFPTGLPTAPSTGRVVNRQTAGSPLTRGRGPERSGRDGSRSPQPARAEHPAAAALLSGLPTPHGGRDRRPAGRRDRRAAQASRQGLTAARGRRP